MAEGEVVIVEALVLSAATSLKYDELMACTPNEEITESHRSVREAFQVKLNYLVNCEDLREVVLQWEFRVFCSYECVALHGLWVHGRLPFFARCGEQNPFSNSTVDRGSKRRGPSAARTGLPFSSR